jgi:serine/threonine protein phosphatase 1
MTAAKTVRALSLRGDDHLAPFRWFGSRPKASTQEATPGDRVIYAVGDVHGCEALLTRLVQAIVEDVAGLRPTGLPVLLFVGDYVDRGPDSKGVIDRLIELQADPRFETCTLKGNHEEALLTFLQDAAFGQTWADYGGLQTLLSYGVTPPALRTNLEEWERVRVTFGEAIPRSHLSFFTGLELMANYGDYTFVHAGVRPGVALQDQDEHDLLYIRREFLDARRPAESVIVHGHTPEAAPFLGDYRIGIDTGAYATGTLTAVRLNGSERTILQVGNVQPSLTPMRRGHQREDTGRR